MQRTCQHWIATKWLELDQDNPLGSRRPAQAGVKDSYPPKKWLFYRNYLV